MATPIYRVKMAKKTIHHWANFRWLSAIVWSFTSHVSSIQDPIDSINSSGLFIFQWDLVCGDDWLIPLQSTLFFAGVLVGAVSSGFLSDAYVAIL